MDEDVLGWRATRAGEVGSASEVDVEERLRGFEERIERLVEAESELQSVMEKERARVDSRLGSVDERLAASSRSSRTRSAR